MTTKLNEKYVVFLTRQKAEQCQNDTNSHSLHFHNFQSSGKKEFFINLKQLF